MNSFKKKTGIKILKGVFSEYKLTASDGSPYARFGYSLDISADGNTAVIGAYKDNTKVNDYGSVYIFARSGSIWTEEQKLVASDLGFGKRFGYSVAISSDGSTVIVGSQMDDPNGIESGSAYIFVRIGSIWTEEEKLTPIDGDKLKWFGRSVSISADGNTAIVGACKDNKKENINELEIGSAYVFSRSGSIWTEEQKLTVENESILLGRSVSISADGNTAVIGAYKDDEAKGSAYVFSRSGSIWTEEQKLIASDRESGDWFGFSVSISADGNTAVIGAYKDDEAKGSAYVFSRSGSIWTEEQKLIASDRESGDWFSRSVSTSFDGNTIILGSQRDSDNGLASGSAYIFTKNGPKWFEKQKLIASDGGKHQYFGRSVSTSFDGNTTIVGAFWDNEKGPDSGSVYVYSILE